MEATTSKRTRMSWREREVLFLIRVVNEEGVLSVLDKKRQRNKSIFKNISAQLQRDFQVDHSW